MSTLASIIAGALSGAGTGTLASIAAPWAQHAVERRRATDERRRKLVEDGRALVIRANKGSWAYQLVEQDPAFFALRPFLSTETRHKYGDWDADGASITVMAHPPHNELRRDIDRIEREWNLI